jgi:predicted transcriptional regulator
MNSNENQDPYTTRKQKEARSSSKVARLIAEYDLGKSFGDKLEELWTADGEERESLRSLADRFNERLLLAAIDDVGGSTLDGEVANLHRLLTSDDVSSGQRTEARIRLRQQGIGIDKLESNFVTYQAIRTYLKEYRGAEYKKPGDRTRVKNVTETVQRLTSRTRSVVENSLNHLQSTSTVSIGKFRIFVEINVLCEDCNSQYGIVELLQRRSCDCERE